MPSSSWMVGSATRTTVTSMVSMPSASVIAARTSAPERPAPLSALAGVEVVELVRVALVDDVALDLQGGRELALLLGEIVVEDREALDLLDLRVLPVGLVEDGLDEGPDLLVLRERGRVAVDAVLLGPRRHLLLVERDERDWVGTAVAVHHGLGDVARLLEVVLEVRGGEVLAARGDDDVLLAACDREEAVVVDLAEVAGMQPALVVEDLLGRLLVRPVAREDAGAAHEDLAVPRDRHLDALERLADGAEAEVVGPVDRPEADRLRHPVALHDRHARRVEELEDLLGDRRGAGRRLAHLAAEQVAHRLEEPGVDGVELLAQLGGDVLPTMLVRADLDPRRDGLADRAHLL